MILKRRNFLGLGALAASGSFLSTISSCSSEEKKETVSAATTVKSLSADAAPVSNAERMERVAKAQRLLAENKMGALILDCGTSMVYFTGVQWWPSERTLVAIIPAKGEVKYVCPGFEEARLREQITIGTDVYTWQEDESPYKLIVSALKDAGVVTGDVGVEERTRFFIVDGVRREGPQLRLVSGDPVTIPCRIIKSPAEIKLMQTATDITLAAIKYSVAQLEEGMSQDDLSSIIMKTQSQYGGNADFALCLFGKTSAFPHGTREPQQLKKGDVVLMDCGCTVHGYNSDVTRTIVFGAEPTKRQEDIWNLEKQAQAAAFAAAQIGATGDAVDAAARKVITDAGFGPGYKLPGTPHRTGHGIGMDGHEWGNMVKGNMQPLAPGMCFSIEPTIAIVGEFGVRFEDCVYMTPEGPKWFSQPSKSIREPFG